MDANTTERIKLEKQQTILLYRQRMLEGRLDRCDSEQEFDRLTTELLELSDKLGELAIALVQARLIEHGRRPPFVTEKK